MTPELPRAPISEPCVTAWQTSASGGVGGQLRELGEDGVHRERHVRAGVAVGHGEDVEPVDLFAALLERRRPRTR